MAEELDLEAIEAREKAATEGPWRWNVNPRAHSVYLESPTGSRQIVIDFARWGMCGAQPVFNENGLLKKAKDLTVTVEGREHHSSWYQTLNHPDADFIAHARVDIPALTREVRRLREENERLLSGMCGLCRLGMEAKR